MLIIVLSMDPLLAIAFVNAYIHTHTRTLSIQSMTRIQNVRENFSLLRIRKKEKSILIFQLNQGIAAQQTMKPLLSILFLFCNRKKKSQHSFLTKYCENWIMGHFEFYLSLSSSIQWIYMENKIIEKNIINSSFAN